MLELTHNCDQREYAIGTACGHIAIGVADTFAATQDAAAARLRTPLQVQLHLTPALEAGYQTGEKPVMAALVETVLSRQLDDLEPTLTRHGYGLKDMVEQFDAKPAEIRALFNNKLEPARTAELRDRMLAAGLPI
ncbi:hypothetical protein RBA41_12305 [Massilia sp. CCM 9210]|uniref:hypothetical protein n=1 Tax=Massilia scottii TaxID=3057166 RepID=UPI002796C956|nr:hypothetical protein [Massilia sp. CCM 9210]MDQ1814089.1 hypothetical protein [Massilia sp. CCM 9210]